VSDLEVRPELRDEMTAYGKHDVDDARIRAALERAYLHDPRVLSFNPDVDVDDGVVTLTGVVSNPLAREAAEEDALATVGVWRVRNLLKVRPAPDERSDAALAGDVEQRLMWDPYVDSTRVGVTVSNDVAYLSGEATSLYERERAEDIAQGVRGVVDVRNLLRLEARPEVKPDWEIREQIRDELFWSPFVDADQVEVRVRDGRATLTGDVDSFAERRAATENAFEGGAVEVDNRLGVLGGPDWIF
jgi:osmotically-inducible protein OsmY